MEVINDDATIDFNRWLEDLQGMSNQQIFDEYFRVVMDINVITYSLEQTYYDNDTDEPVNINEHNELSEGIRTHNREILCNEQFITVQQYEDTYLRIRREYVSVHNFVYESSDNYINSFVNDRTRYWLEIVQNDAEKEGRLEPVMSMLISGNDFYCHNGEVQDFNIDPEEAASSENICPLNERKENERLICLLQ